MTCINTIIKNIYDLYTPLWSATYDFDLIINDSRLTLMDKVEWLLINNGLDLRYIQKNADQTITVIAAKNSYLNKYLELVKLDKESR